MGQTGANDETSGYRFGQSVVPPGVTNVIAVTNGQPLTLTVIVEGLAALQ